jgi:hypothetical protein
MEGARYQDVGVNGLVVGCLTILLTVSDAFETGHYGMAHQGALWLVISLLLVTQVSVVRHLVERSLPANSPWSALSIPLTIMVTVLLMAVELHWLKSTPLLPKQPDPLVEFLVFLTPPIGAMASLVLLAQHFSRRSVRLQTLESQDSKERTPEPQALQTEDAISMEWIAQHCEVLHVQALDHYLEVNCKDQKLLVRGRMRDAIECLQSANGIQVHRSHWIAINQIKRLYRAGRDSKLLLVNGSVVPVARSRVARLRQELN